MPLGVGSRRRGFIMRRGAGVCLGGAILLMLFAAPSAGTTVRKFTLAEVTSRAARIIEIKIAGATPRRDRLGRPATQYTANISESLKGDAQKTVDWTQPGGTIDGETLVIAGIPQFTAGDEMILFLSEESTAGLRLPIGLGQGAFRERYDLKTKKTVVAADPGAIELVDPATGKKTIADRTEFERGAFLTEVRRLIIDNKSTKDNK